MPNIGPAEILVILVVALLVFGPHKLPEIGRQVGQAMRELRRVQASLRDEVREVLEPVSPAAGTPPTLPRPQEETPAAGEAPAAGPEAPAAGPPAVEPPDADHADDGEGVEGPVPEGDGRASPGPEWGEGQAGASGPSAN